MTTNDDKREQAVPCKICTTPTLMQGTKLCDRCYEIESRARLYPDDVERVLNYLGWRVKTPAALLRAAEAATATDVSEAFRKAAEIEANTPITVGAGISADVSEAELAWLESLPSTFVKEGTWKAVWLNGCQISPHLIEYTSEHTNYTIAVPVHSNDRCMKRMDYIAQCVEFTPRLITALRAARKREGEAVEYAQHKRDCPRSSEPKFGQVRRICTCGLDTFLAARDTAAGGGA